MATRPSAQPSRLSLKGRALQLLSQREHSRSELRRKLLAYLRSQEQRAARQTAALSGAAGAPSQLEGPPDDDLGTDNADAHAEQVDALLDWLQAERYLSEERFVESRIHVRAARYGNRRIQQELAQHGVSLSAESAQTLKDTELQRALEVWRRKYTQMGQDAAERARQARFLAARGFSPEVIRRVVQGRVEP